MPYKRIIPIVLLDDEDVIKTESFMNPIYIGDPVNICKIFSDKGANEICLLDVNASKRGSINYNLIEEISSDVFVPLSYGGGIKSLSDAEQLFNIGIEKIFLNSLFFRNINIIKSIITKFGSQAVGISLDLMKTDQDIFVISNEHRCDFFDVIEMLKELNPGEVLIQDILNEGTRKGLDIALIKRLNKVFNLPLTYSGGANSKNDIITALDHIDSVGVGSFFIFSENTKSPLISYMGCELYYD